MVKEKSIKRNYIFNILLNISKILFPLITAPYVSRVLEPDGVGLFNFANTYASYFAVFAVLGTNIYGVREIAKIRDSIKDQSRFFSEVFSLTCITTLIISVIFLVTILIQEKLNENYLIFLFSGLILYSTPFHIEWFFQGREEFGYITSRSLIIKTLSVFALFLFVKEKDDLIIYVLINALSLFCNEAWNFFKLFNIGIRISFSCQFKKHLKPTLLLFASSVAVSIYTMLDTLMLGYISNYNEVGFYNSATHISKCALPVVTSLSTVVMPRLSYYLKDNDWGKISNLMNKSLSVVSFLCFPVSIAIAVMAPVFVPLFFGSQFNGAIIPLQIIIFIVVAIGLNNLTGVQVLVGLGFDKLFLYSVLIGTFSNFILNIILIPYWGAVGASIASVSAETLILIVTTFFVFRKTPIRLNKFKEVFCDILLSFLFIPLMMFMRLYFEGWILIGFFIISGSLVYITLQLKVKNTSANLFLDLIVNKLKK